MNPSPLAADALGSASSEADPRALALLARLWMAQDGLGCDPALAWERALFSDAFTDPEPARRVQAFLGR
ncbi:MAG: hypothetical protein JST05_11180 [Acidobacteria bacterium]|nr:hypothetical protein [Acidobacteriota bacterium]